MYKVANKNEEYRVDKYLSHITTVTPNAFCRLSILSQVVTAPYLKYECHVLRKREDDIKQDVNIWADITEGVYENVMRSRDERDKGIEDPHNEQSGESKLQSPFKIEVVQVIQSGGYKSVSREKRPLGMM